MASKSVGMFQRPVEYRLNRSYDISAYLFPAYDTNYFKNINTNMLGDQFNNVFTFDHFFDAGFEDKFNVIVFVKDYSNKLDLNAVFQRIISNLLIVKRQINEGYISFLNIYYDSFFKNSYGQVIDEVIAFLLDREELIKSSGELNFSLL